MKWLVWLGLIIPIQASAQRIKPLPVLMTMAITADCATTIWFRHNQPWREEVNPLLGKKPSDARIIGTCAVGLVGMNLLGARLHGWIKPTFYLGYSAISIDAALYNRYELGLRLPI